jgi:hypothetical protein
VSGVARGSRRFGGAGATTFAPMLDAWLCAAARKSSSKARRCRALFREARDGTFSARRCSTAASSVNPSAPQATVLVWRNGPGAHDRGRCLVNKPERWGRSRAFRERLPRNFLEPPPFSSASPDLIVLISSEGLAQRPRLGSSEMPRGRF